MSNTTAIDNFTVTSTEHIIPGGELIVDHTQATVLTISPNQGYQVNATDFFINSASQEVDVPNSFFYQSGSDVKLNVLFLANAVMPFSNLEIKICMRGGAGEIGAVVGGFIYFDTANASPPFGTATFSNEGPADTTETVISELIVADADYYFQQTPTISLRSCEADNYNFYTTGSVFNAEGRLTAIRVNADYTYPFANAQGDEIDIYGHAIIIPVINEIVTAWGINTSVPATVASNRDLAIFGGTGAQYSLSIDNGATFSNNQATIQGTIPVGQALENINFPSVKGGVVHTLQFNLNYPAGDSDLDPARPAEYWTIVFDRSIPVNIELSGTIGSFDGIQISDNGPTTWQGQSTSNQLSSIMFTLVGPIGTTLEWNDTLQIPESAFTKNEDLPDGIFTIAGANKNTDGPNQVATLTVQSSTGNTGVNDMSFSMSALTLQSYLTINYECQRYDLTAGQQEDGVFEYYDCGDLSPTLVTVNIGTVNQVCASTVFPPTLVNGQGTVVITQTPCVPGPDLPPPD